MINEKLTDTSPGAAADTRKKFVVLVDEGAKKQIDALAAVTRTGKIELASQILAIGLAEATAVARSGGKIDSEGNPVGVKPKAKKEDFEDPEDEDVLEDEEDDD